MCAKGERLERKRANALEILKEWEEGLESQYGKENLKNMKANQVSITKVDRVNSYPIVLTATDISKILKISKPSAYDLMEQSDFPLIRIGRCKRVMRDEFFLWLKKN